MDLGEYQGWDPQLQSDFYVLNAGQATVSNRGEIIKHRCVRSTLLFGIAGGAVVGATRFVTARSEGNSVE